MESENVSSPVSRRDIPVKVVLSCIRSPLKFFRIILRFFSVHFLPVLLNFMTVDRRVSVWQIKRIFFKLFDVEMSAFTHKNLLLMTKPIWNGLLLKFSQWALFLADIVLVS